MKIKIATCVVCCGFVVCVVVFLCSLLFASLSRFWNQNNNTTTLIMPLKLDVKKKFSAISDRVKSVEIHPTEPWILAALFDGHVNIWNYATQVSLFLSLFSQLSGKLFANCPQILWGFFLTWFVNRL